MRFVVQVLGILRKGTRPQRIQAAAGLALIGLVALYLAFYLLWKVLFIAVAFLGGMLLLRRAVRPQS
jgi:hypothetical protein